MCVCVHRESKIFFSQVVHRDGYTVNVTIAFVSEGGLMRFTTKTYQVKILTLNFTIKFSLQIQRKTVYMSTNIHMYLHMPIIVSKQEEQGIYFK